MTDPWFFEVLACRPAPYPDECLSGYVLRLAQVNGYAILWDLVSNLFPMWKYPQQIGLLCWEYPVENWGQIPLFTQLPPDELINLTVAPWMEKFRILPERHRSIYWGPGVFLNDVVSRVLRVCPLCLQAQPYLRLIWRLEPISVCLEHSCLLQDKCPKCGITLTPIGQTHRHLHCPACNADLLSLPVVRASEDVLQIQKRRQADIHFLLDPANILVESAHLDDSEASHNLTQAIGLKLRYLRHRSGISVSEMAQRVGITSRKLTIIERGECGTFHCFSAYLEALSFTWSDFASLDIPTEHVQSLRTPRYQQLRLCPDPECPNHQLPLRSSVRLKEDLPEKRMARFHCNFCDKSFVRSYDGKLITPQIRRSTCCHLPAKQRPPQEIARLVEMGLQGIPNAQIAQCLQWPTATVRAYWNMLNLESLVRRAQAEKRSIRRLEKHASKDRVEAILKPLLDQGQFVTLGQVSSALGSKHHLNLSRSLETFVRDSLKQHNALVKKRQDEMVRFQIMQAIEKLQATDHIVKVAEIAQQAGLSCDQFRGRYPELRQIVHQAILEHRERIKISQLATKIEKINRAATRLIAQGVRLNYLAILKEAGVSDFSHNNPKIRDALMRWTGDFAPRD